MEAILSFWDQYAIIVVAVGTPLLTYLVGLGGSMVRIYTMILHALSAARDGNYSAKEKVETVDDIIAVAKGFFWNKSK